MARPLSRIAALLIASLAFGTAAAAQAPDLTRDLPGAKDHPLVPRYEGSVIFGYKFDRFTEANIPLGLSFRDHQRNVRGFEKVETIEGPRTRILYLMPRQRTSLEALRDYTTALTAKGFFTAWECACDACGEQVEEAVYGFKAERKITDTQTMEYAFTMVVEEPRLWVGRLDRPQGPLWVTVFAAFAGNAANPAAGNRVQVLVDISDKGNMEQRMVTVRATEMATNIGRDGRQAIYGILFDFDKAEIKPDSKAQLDEMAALLRNEPALKVHIVGHTDNQGSVDYNTVLSQRRAEAVVRALATQYGIAPARLTGRGLGPYAPVTSNDTEEGRTKNWRVELVKQ